ncbi:cytochrome P450 [Novosphingobium sp. KCTC 2891]|uniref:cytochrome P450 n=1 Tax=Novosphingobium sp. KCTC 2891 TaxID=2989730 RepID=UPI002222CCAC|nr:cytochrome P450 [Novosphingobium sp. KCTC 2891]MCW1381786.1 cytochrome P450 [Novosphingobium sp. KCTC 2891]
MQLATPPHVPADRVVDFDIFNPPGVERDYFAAWRTLQAPGTPGLVWSTANGGHWIATRGELVRTLWADAERLSSECLAVTPGLGEVMRFIPLQQDPPEHGPFRTSVMKGLASRFVVALEPKVEAVAQELVDGLRPRGACDFVADFAEILPLNIFLSLIDVPLEDRPRLRTLGVQLTRPDGSMTVEQLRDAADDYLWPFIEQRMAAPGDDLFSRILSEGVGGRPWSVDEARRMCRNLLFGGLDTVAAMIGMVTLHLARHPEDQHLLRERPDLIPTAADELMRRYPTVSVSRNAVVDVEADGVTIRKGDIVYLPSVLHNLDPACFDAPDAVDYARGLTPVRHTTMGAGAHRCVGAGLARMEMIVFLRTWLAAMPAFALDPERPVTMKGGNVGACTALPLVW